MAAYAPLAGIPNVTQGQEQLNQNALAEYTHAAQEKQQTALLQQQTQAANLENQQKQIQLQDQQALNKAMQNWDGKDPAALLQSAKQNGLSAQGYLQGQQSILARQQQLATLSKDQLNLMDQHHNAALGVIDAHKSVPDEQLAQSMTDAAQQLQAQGHLAPNEAQAVVQHVQSMPPDQFRPWLDVYEKGLMGEKEQIATAKEQASTQEEAAKARAENATAAHQEFLNKLTANSKPGDFDTQVDALVPPTGAQGQAQNQFVKAQVNSALSRGDVDGAKKFIEQAYQNQLGITKDIAVATNPDIQKGKIDLATAEGRAKMEAQLSLLSPEARAMAAQYFATTGAMPSGLRSPGMSAGILNTAAGPAGTPTPNVAANKMAYGTETAEQKAFTSGSQGQQLTAIGTARNHMQTFMQTADALDNGNFLLANRVGNALGMQFGSDKATNFNIAKSAFAGEVGKAFAGANVGVQDRQELMDKISAASSPAQLKGYAQKADELLAGKQKSLKESYDQGMQGKPNFGNSAPATKTYQGHTYEQQSDGSWKLQQK